jgi:hypothetical protein
MRHAPIATCPRPRRQAAASPGEDSVFPRSRGASSQMRAWRATAFPIAAPSLLE